MLKTYLKGLLMGTADLVPGVSGGTIALITGIYDELIKSITELTYIPQQILKKDFSFFKTTNYKLLIPLFLGIATAIFLGARIISHLLLNYPGFTYSFFIGLIIASVYFLAKPLVDKINATIGIITGTIIGIILSFLVLNIQVTGILGTFFLGFFAITAMILPGISGSYILLILGQYEYAINLVKNLPTTWFMTLIFMLGCLIGLLVLSRLINYLIKKYSDMTHGVLVGLMFGTLIVPLRLVFETNPSWIILAFILAGISIIKLMK